MKYQPLKQTLKGLAILYAVAGSCYMTGQDVTGHPSADMYLRKVQPTKLDRVIMDSFTPKGLESTVLGEEK